VGGRGVNRIWSLVGSWMAGGNGGISIMQEGAVDLQHKEEGNSHPCIECHHPKCSFFAFDLNTYMFKPMYTIKYCIFFPLCRVKINHIKGL
jgi:hypothetical protein